jgi:hypothetical protein
MTTRAEAEEFVRERLKRLKPWETPDEREVKFGVELILHYEINRDAHTEPFKAEDYLDNWRVRFWYRWLTFRYWLSDKFGVWKVD